MLEKIGLPAKPSMRGSNWVVDASHCQGCSSQFTFLNRKHHCRRCGGLFCNSCTQQRMVLRGQGDSPVRICDPCKKLEEAARFELRYGNKNKAGKGGGSKVEPKHEDELLNEILGTDRKRPFSSARESTDVVSELQRAASSSSCSNLQEEAVTRDGEGDILGSTSIENEIGSRSPEELRQQALEEKKKYRLLKGEGKSEEALLAFKRGKELERQAGAVEIALRKSRRKALTSNSSASIHKTTDRPQESGQKSKIEEKDDLASELRVLGWSDADLQDADRKPAKISLEGELSNLLGEVSHNSNGERKTSGIDKTQVLVLKKNALMLKREGKLAEAKEELKRAKVLEKQIEEQELLAGSEDSDDELSALIRSMDDGDDKHDDFSLDYSHDPGIDLERLVSVADDIAIDGNFDVTDADMNDPEIAVALQSFGWTGDSGHSDDDVLQSVPRDTEALKQEVLSLKREALNLKRSGNVAKAMAQLKKAKLLEKEIEDLQSQSQSNSQNNTAPSNSMRKPSMSVEADMKDHDHVLPPKSKLAIQKELLGLKKKALALRREGRFDEAEEELKKGKALEHQLEEMDNAPKAANVGRKDRDSEPVRKHPGAAETLALGDEEEEEADVTEQDMHDPAMLSVLKNLGWEDDDVALGSVPRQALKKTDGNSRSTTEVLVQAPRSKAEIQRELLGLKRKALALRREGKSEEAEEELTKAKALEAQMVEMEAPQKEPLHGSLGGREKCGRVEDDIVLPSSIEHIGLDAEDDPMVDVSDADLRDPRLVKALKDLDWKENDITKLLPVSSSVLVPETSLPNQDKHLSIAKAGSTAELGLAKQANFLPQSDGSVNLFDYLTGNEWNNPHLSVEKLSTDGISETNMSANLKEKVGIVEEISSSRVLNRVAERRERAIPTVEKTPTHNADPGVGPNSQTVQSSGRQEILARKRKAVALKREGKLAEAREELRQAKLLEKSLEVEHHQLDTGHMDVVVSTSDSISAVQESRTNQAPKPMSGRDRFKLQQESLAHKRQALKLRREGRIEESEAEFELAKALETQLEELGGHDSAAGKSKSKAEATDGVVIDDLLDPQLLSALKEIGWQDADIVERPQEKTEAKPTFVEKENTGWEKAELEERIKAEKIRALNLKRAGKQGEALDALRRAKQLEKKLNS
ncbi:uncharacterized protein LOC131241345 [Magnolia sinica]|uniref:uncharacterized protein LOC131241345 n=1 Tax=Magnolia sinica TaxID=86752 RepID=UPI002659B94D|nr:uncharacterized protein LOC131241345 [Magnolia sinica]XP_058096144.1 uncharacterized protein LOC131241345 [Magnolia sinica]